MPTYELEVGGKVHEIDSDSELSPEQLGTYAKSLGTPAASAKTAGAGRGLVNPPRVKPDPEPEPGILDRIGTEVGYAKEGAKKILSSLSPTPEQKEAENQRHLSQIAKFKANPPDPAAAEGVGTTLKGVGEAGLGMMTMGDYQPKTSAGKVLTEAIGIPARAVGDAFKGAGRSVGRILGNENAGEAVGEVLPAALPLKNMPALMREARATRSVAPLTQRETARAETVDAGYGLMPNSNKSKTNSALSVLGKEENVKNTLTLKNQEVTNNIAKKELGLDDTHHLDEGTFVAQRAPYYQKYDAVKDMPFKIKVDQTLIDKVNSLGDKTLDIQASFPEYRGSPDTARAQNLVSKSSPVIAPRATVELVKKLREDARHDLSRRELSSSEKDAANAKIDIANALEDQLDRGLAAYVRTVKDPKVAATALQDLRTARREIAKSHNVQDATNLVTGDVDATKIGAMKDKGVPLSGGLETIARARKTAKDVVRNTDGVTPKAEFSIGDMGMAAGGALLGTAAAGPAGAAGLAAAATRPAARALATSRGYQNRMVRPRGRVSQQDPDVVAPLAMSSALAQKEEKK